ncbi:MAG: agmatinase family protein [Bdellovibrionaceae bacterium]|nr:agmatinase family protein [Pseudobdellovibrionaceae bacterium]MBX3032661.1 agmatinase family protein [Pseudobdellovibrionaceae bacterium]
MAQFDPTTTISADFGIFGIPLSEDESRVVLLPVPWEVTTSYGAGASLGPSLVRNASEQVDLFDIETGKAYEAGYHMLPFPEELKAKNDRFKEKAQLLIELRTNLSEDHERMDKLVQEVNQACEEMTAWVSKESLRVLKAGKLLGLVGGDHSTPLGAIRAVSSQHQGDFGVLHIDAHADLRQAYQGFTQSHASIMYNVMSDPLKPKKLVQVGIRDFSEEEYELSESRPDIKTFFDLQLKKRLMEGESWAAVCRDILKELPQKVYVSFDIDGLDPAFCPHTGTPVPGGLSVDQVFYLFSQIAATGRRIVGFDVNEVSSGGGDEADAEWDGNVGARVLYKLCGWSVVTNEGK